MEISTNVAQGRPKDDHRRTEDLVPHILDYLASTQPSGLFAEYPISATSYGDGYRSVSYSDFANAVNGLAFWLQDSLGPPRAEYEVLTYMGPNDLRYPALVLACIKAGYILFLTSPRNSVPAHLRLLENLKCETLLAPKPRPPQVQPVADASSIKIADVPSVDDLLNRRYPHFPYGKTYSEELDKPMFVVHTSGSTGFPKPLIYRHTTAATNMRLMALEPPDGYECIHRQIEGKRVFMTFPPFHGAYLVMSLFNCLQLGTVFLSPISGAIPSAEGLVQGLKKASAHIAFIVPSIVLELAENPQMLDYVSRNVQFVIYCGGDLPQYIGDKVASKVRLINQYGASELGLCALIQSKSNYDPKDWKYVQFHPKDGHEFRRSVENTFEYCMVYNKAFEEQQPTFTIFPGTTEYASRDLFVQHPTKPDLWSWKARADDIIVFLNGEKTNPVSMEQHIVARNPAVTAALVIGAQRFQASLLLELNMSNDNLSVQQRASAIEQVWPSIEEANRDCPAHAKVEKTHILFTSPRKPVLRAGKGTVQRAATLSQFESEIEKLYADADKIAIDGDDHKTQDVANIEDPESLSSSVHKIIASVLKTELDTDDSSFYEVGIDSLQALLVVRALRQTLMLPTIALSTIYNHPSVRDLTQEIVRLSRDASTLQEREADADLKDRAALLEETKLRIEQMHALPDVAHKSISGHTVLLTGSTGTFGSFILSRLMNDPNVEQIYCLNRHVDSAGLQARRSVSRGLPTNFPVGKVTFVTADLNAPFFGLPGELYSKMQSTTTLIIHAAWPVNFNLPLNAFKPSLYGLVALLDFTASTSLRAHFHFISSITSVMSSGISKSIGHASSIPERVLPSPSTPLPNGYAESKHIAELLLDFTSSAKGLSVSFSRVGQIAGAVGFPSLWNTTEWFPSLIISCAHLSAVPVTLGRMDRIDWFPIDLLADVLVEVTLAEASGATVAADAKPSIEPDLRRTHVYHLVYPHHTEWPSILPAVASVLESYTKKPLTTTSTNEWMQLIRMDMESNIGPKAGNRVALTEEELVGRLRHNPATKLLEFYESIMSDKAKGTPATILDIQETMRFSSKMRSLEKFGNAWVSKWVDEWMRVPADPI
ncbi:MAG: putative NRPS-like protein biosynthetic cluster [Bogoriella megaspora]|nr:MAG: putative NRPS-like protein biosynthetic cluster [Bogoriella megaspora]